MDCVIEAVLDFIRLRQLNIVLGVLFTVLYFAYQYRGVLFKWDEEELYPSRSCRRLSRSKSRSRSHSRADYRTSAERHRRGGRRSRRCPDCSQCNDQDM